MDIKRELTMTRLLTLTGVGGSGKTRLALEVAKDLVGAYPDGVWLVELASLSEGDLLPQAVAKAMGVPERPGQPLTDTLAEYLRAKSVLLVVDNYEHLANSAASLLDTLLDSCPRLRHLQFDTDRAEAAALEGIELCAEAQMDGSLAAAFRWKLGYAARLRGDYERAQELVEESLAFSREADDKIGMADALLELGAISFLLGDPERAKEHSEEGIALCRELGYGLQLANHLSNLGYQMLLEGDYERGAALNEEAAALSRERGYKGGLGFALDFQGWVALLKGDHERARISYRDSLTLCKELGDKMVARASLDGLACICAAEGASERQGCSGRPKCWAKR